MYSEESLDVPVDAAEISIGLPRCESISFGIPPNIPGLTTPFFSAANRRKIGFSRRDVRWCISHAKINPARTMAAMVRP